MPKQILENKKIAIIVAFRDFKEEEYFTPSHVFKSFGAEITTVSNKLGTALSEKGRELNVDADVKGLNVNDFDAVVFIGGPGALSNLDNEESYRVIQEAVEREKVLGAICIAPMILAKAGALREKRATVWSSELDRFPVKILEGHGAIYDEVMSVVTDGKVVTANGPQAANDWAQAVAMVLLK